MEDPHSVHIRCDGSMAYTKDNPGGIGGVIEFPVEYELKEIEFQSYVDKQNVHRLEIQAMIYAIEIFIKFLKQNKDISYKIQGVIIHTDRESVSDSSQMNPSRVATQRKANWQTQDKTPVKNADLINKLDKLRTKLSSITFSRVEIVYTPRKKNKKADKLSKKARKKGIPTKSQDLKIYNKVCKRIYPDNPEIDYSLLNINDTLTVRVYLKDFVQKKCHVKSEIMDGIFKGKKVCFWVSFLESQKLHRHHIYQITISTLSKYSINSIKEDYTEYTT